MAAPFYVASGFRSEVVSRAGAQGPAQILPSQWAQHADRVGAHDPNDPADSAAVLVAMDCTIIQHLQETGQVASPENIVAAWVGGPQSVGSGQAGEVGRVVEQVDTLLADENR